MRIPTLIINSAPGDDYRVVISLSQPKQDVCVFFSFKYVFYLIYLNLKKNFINICYIKAQKRVSIFF